MELFSALFFISASLSGLLLYVGSPIKVVVAQDLVPKAPASVAGVVMGMSTAIGAILYIAIGKVQDLAGVTPGVALGFALVLPAAAIAHTVFTSP